ncbi:reverse transcriptase domain-containing protein [Ensifer aridi]|uniref:reverse transcriptase domain-containing protein n=1 Tax=Ensifer aridi TaxID=1708715 RepID=UPI001FCD7329|nr:reverse transcriptase domain-containing protein [Ensifer aridi]
MPREPAVDLRRANCRIRHDRKGRYRPRAFQKNIDAELALIRRRVYAESYRFTPFKQRLISKRAGKAPREIAIAGVRDRVTLRAVTNVLMDVFHDAKLAPAHFIIKDLLDFVRPLGDEYVFLQLDVQDFYPSLDHQLLLKRIRTRTRHRYFTTLVDAAVKTPTGDGKKTNHVGVPQGLSVSNILSSIYMMQIDESAATSFTRSRPRSQYCNHPGPKSCGKTMPSFGSTMHASRLRTNSCATRCAPQEPAAASAVSTVDGEPANPVTGIMRLENRHAAPSVTGTGSRGP